VTSNLLTRGVLMTAVSALAITLTACSSDDSSDSSASSDTSASSSAAAETSAMPASDEPFGAGCSAVPTEGAGSFTGMAADPVATAASNNPLLTTLVSAVSGELNPKVNLVDTLNGGQFTVFAPVDDAFAKVPASTVNTLKTDPALLTKVLTYHVVPGQIAPDQIAGTQKTVEGGTVDVAGSGDALTVNGAHVICGGVKTANATVYLIDAVLMPTM
jgi:uncharacterized surface protein with fasciclin (FAS1) repeats